jgi:hypothetical protein
MEKFTTARGGSSWLIRGLATALALGVMSSASPVLFNEPFVASSDALQVLKRSTSQDASCPSSFLCVAEQCPANVICPDGQSCINFEGNLACAPSGTNFCALNPTSFEAVRCDGGICW